MSKRKKYSKEELYLANLLQDFPTYLQYAFKMTNLPPPTPLQLDIAKEIGKGNKRFLLEAFRGIGKTLITGIYASWRLLRNKEEKILIISATSIHATAISTYIKSLLSDLPVLNHLIPGPDQRNSVMSFDVAGSLSSVQPSVKCLGITSQLQGNRATLIIADDVETSINSATEIMRQKIQTQINEFDSILKTDSHSSILALGTPQSLDSIYNRFPSKGFLVRIYPAQIPEKIELYEGKLAPYIEDLKSVYNYEVGDATDTRFSLSDLQEREYSTGKSYYMLQYMLDTTLSDANKYPLKQSDMIVYDIGDKAPVSIGYSQNTASVITDVPNIGFTGDSFYSPSYVDNDFIDFQQTFMAIDPSGQGSDEQGYAIVSLTHGKVFIRQVGGMKGGYQEENLMKLALEAKKYKVQKVFIESNFGDGMFDKLFTPYLMKFNPCEVEPVRHNTQKEVRIIDTLEPLLNQHKLVFDLSMIKKDITRALEDPDYISYSLIYQLTHITKQRGSLKHDDRLDALAIALKQLDEYVGVNTDDALKAFKEDQFQKELNLFINGFNSTNGTNFLDSFKTL
jgi:hypothetical protein